MYSMHFFLHILPLILIGIPVCICCFLFVLWAPKPKSDQQQRSSPAVRSSSNPVFRKSVKTFFDSSTGDFAQEVALHKRLAVVCFGDKEKAVRLIHYEMGRAPNISRIEATRRVLERLQRDRQ